MLREFGGRRVRGQITFTPRRIDLQRARQDELVGVSCTWLRAPVISSSTGLDKPAGAAFRPFGGAAGVAWDGRTRVRPKHWPCPAPRPPVARKLPLAQVACAPCEIGPDDGYGKRSTQLADWRGAADLIRRSLPMRAQAGLRWAASRNQPLARAIAADAFSPCC